MHYKTCKNYPIQTSKFLYKNPFSQNPSLLFQTAIVFLNYGRNLNFGLQRYSQSLTINIHHPNLTNNHIEHRATQNMSQNWQDTKVLIQQLAQTTQVLQANQAADRKQAREMLREAVQQFTLDLRQQNRKMQVAMLQQGRKIEANMQQQVRNMRAAIQQQGRNMQANTQQQVRSLRAAIQQQGRNMEANMKQYVREMKTSIQQQSRNIHRKQQQNQGKFRKIQEKLGIPVVRSRGGIFTRIKKFFGLLQSSSSHSSSSASLLQTESSALKVRMGKDQEADGKSPSHLQMRQPQQIELLANAKNEKLNR